MNNTTFRNVEVYKEDFEFSVMFRIHQNGEKEKLSTLFLQEKYDLRLRISSDATKWDLSIHSDIAYRYIVDSTLNLINDDFIFSLYKIRDSGSKFNQTYSVMLKTGFFPSYTLKRGVDDTFRKMQSAQFFAPGTVNLSYGFSYHFWKYSFLTVSLASVKWERDLVYEKPSGGRIYGAYSPKSSYDYGFSITARINKDLSNRIRWTNHSYIFCNSPERENFRLDFNNQLRFSLLRYLAFSIHTKLNYRPVNEYKFNLIQEFRIGFEWDFTE